MQECLPFWWEGLVTSFYKELFVVTVRSLSWGESAKLEVGTLYGLSNFSLITFTYIECNLPFYCQAPSKGRSAVTLKSVVDLTILNTFVSCILYVCLFKALTVTARKITVYMLIIHNYSHESMYSYLLCKCLLGNTNLNPSHSFTSFQMDAFLLPCSTAPKYVWW